jgi:hypothetical protein
VWAGGAPDPGSLAAAILSHFDGTTWSPAIMNGDAKVGPSVIGIAGTNDQFSLATTDNLLLFHNTNGQFNSYPAVAAPNALSGALWDGTWAGTVGGGLYTTNFGGSTWTPVATGTTQTLRSISGTNLADLWAVGDGGVIAHIEPWKTAPVSLVAPLTTNNLGAIASDPQGDLWAVGDHGTILHYGAPRCQTDADCAWRWSGCFDVCADLTVPLPGGAKCAAECDSSPKPACQCVNGACSEPSGIKNYCGG